MIITIDGPTASGKSTVARMIAQKLGWYYLYSGLLFRGLGYLLMRDKGYTLEMLSESSEDDIAAILNPERFVYTFDAMHGERLAFDGIDITVALKERTIDQAASIVGTNPYVRDYLMCLQRAIAQTHDVVIDGRDAGSVVFPHAQVKFFLTAHVQERARRWKAVHAQRGVAIALAHAVAFIMERDLRDQERTCAPLKIPAGAIQIDSTTLTPEQTVEMMMEQVVCLSTCPPSRPA